MLGRTGGKYEIASIAPALRSCFPEYRVPKLNRRYHGVFVSEMPAEEEEEEEIDEDASIDGLEDVENFINEDDESDFTLDEDEVREVLATKKCQKRDFVLRKEEIPRGSGRAQTENEVQSMWTCGTVGERMSAKILARSQRRWERKSILGKMNSFQRKRGEKRTSVTGTPETNHDSSVSLRGTVRCFTGFADVVNNVVRCWKKQCSLSWNAIESVVNSRHC